MRSRARTRASPPPRATRGSSRPLAVAAGRAVGVPGSAAKRVARALLCVDDPARQRRHLCPFTRAPTCPDRSSPARSTPSRARVEPPARRRRPPPEAPARGGGAHAAACLPRRRRCGDGRARGLYSSSSSRLCLPPGVEKRRPCATATMAGGVGAPRGHRRHRPSRGLVQVQGNLDKSTPPCRRTDVEAGRGLLTGERHFPRRRLYFPRSPRRLLIDAHQICAWMMKRGALRLASASSRSRQALWPSLLHHDVAQSSAAAAPRRRRRARFQTILAPSAAPRSTQRATSLAADAKPTQL